MHSATLVAEAAQVAPIEPATTSGIEDPRDKTTPGASPESLEGEAFPEIPKYQKWILWTGVALIAYANGLDNFTMSVYLQTAASQFNGIVQYTTLGVIQSMILAVGMPPFAKFADIFGRAAGYGISILFFTIGTITLASSKNIGNLSAGMVFFAIGNTGLTISQQLVLADLVSPRWRTTISNVLTVHFIINFGIASKVTAALVPNNWRWGVGMFSIINPVVTAPVVGVLAIQQYQAYKAGLLRPYPYKGLGPLAALRAFLIDIDILGLFALTGGFLLLLLPLTIADKAPHGYQSGYIIAMFVLGGLLLLAWPFIELKVPHPLVNLKDFFVNPDVMIPAAIIFVDHFSFAMTYTPAFQWCQITFGWDTSDATYFYYTQTLCLVVFAIIGGFIATVTRRYKWITFAGACIRLLGLGLMIRYRDSRSSTFQAVMPQVVQGLGGGLITANIMVVAQAAVPHSEVAIVTGFYLLILELGSAIGTAAVGAVQQKLHGELHHYLDPLVNATVVETIYAQGNTALLELGYPIGTPVRTATINAWSDNMHQILIGAITIAAVDVLLTAALADRKLSNHQNNVTDEPVAVPAPAALLKTGRPNHDRV